MKSSIIVYLMLYCYRDTSYLTDIRFTKQLTMFRSNNWMKDYFLGYFSKSNEKGLKKSKYFLSNLSY